MFIKRLRLKNFTSYVFAEIDFPKTSIAIVVLMGLEKVVFSMQSSFLYMVKALEVSFPT